MSFSCLSDRPLRRVANTPEQVRRDYMKQAYVSDYTDTVALLGNNLLATSHFLSNVLDLGYILQGGWLITRNIKVIKLIIKCDVNRKLRLAAIQQEKWTIACRVLSTRMAKTGPNLALRRSSIETFYKSIILRSL